MPGIRTSMITTSGCRPQLHLDRALPAGGLADDANVRRAEQREGEALAHDLIGRPRSKR
jgi:hypothetical protein